MKVTTIVILFSMLCSFSYAQNKAKGPKASPADSSIVTTDDGVKIAIHYSSPSLKGREIGVDIAKVGQRWRTGANETTTVEFDKNVIIEGQKLAAGKYALNSIPGEQSSTIIFNSKWDQWGTKYDEKDDVLKIEVPNRTNQSVQERLKIEANKSGKILLDWGQYGLSLGVKADK